MPLISSFSRKIAVVGAGLAGSACAAGMLKAGLDVVVYDKSAHVGGRLATRREQWVDAEGQERRGQFDHGAPDFTAQRRRFRAVIAEAIELGWVAEWQRHSYPDRSVSTRTPTRFVGVPGMPALCRWLLTDVPLRLEHTVTRLHRDDGGWRLETADGTQSDRFDEVVLTLPPVQSAFLLDGHRDDWSAALNSIRSTSCWTLMAASDGVDWPWDVAEPEDDVLSIVIRNDRKPGRWARPGMAHWVAHATSRWTARHLEHEADEVAQLLGKALVRFVAERTKHWHHFGAHRWRYAMPTHAVSNGREYWWDPVLRLGVCGDAFGQGNVESAWCAGDELASVMTAASVDQHSLELWRTP